MEVQETATQDELLDFVFVMLPRLPPFPAIQTEAYDPQLIDDIVYVSQNVGSVIVDLAGDVCKKLKFPHDPVYTGQLPGNYGLILNPNLSLDFDAFLGVLEMRNVADKLVENIRKFVNERVHETMPDRPMLDVIEVPEAFDHQPVDPMTPIAINIYTPDPCKKGLCNSAYAIISSGLGVTFFTGGYILELEEKEIASNLTGLEEFSKVLSDPYYMILWDSVAAFLISPATLTTTYNPEPTTTVEATTTVEETTVEETTVAALIPPPVPSTTRGPAATEPEESTGIVSGIIGGLLAFLLLLLLTLCSAKHYGHVPMIVEDVPPADDWGDMSDDGLDASLNAGFAGPLCVSQEYNEADGNVVPPTPRPRPTPLPDTARTQEPRLDPVCVDTARYEMDRGPQHTGVQFQHTMSTIQTEPSIYE
eukprot:Selendium_serpulae@DN5995_c1_g1_i2.p1